MNAPLPITRCDGCGVPSDLGGIVGHDGGPLDPVDLFTHDGRELCGACLSEALDEHEEPEPDTSESLALADRAGRL